MSLLQFSVKGKAYNATKTEITTRKFRFLVDEPQGLGGEDDAPNPVEYILAGYAGCLNVVAHLVARERNIQIRSLEIDIEGDINPDKLFGVPDAGRAGFQAIRVNIRIDSDASRQEITDLIAAVKERCPVNDNLTNTTPVSYLVNQPVFLN